MEEDFGNDDDDDDEQEVFRELQVVANDDFISRLETPFRQIVARVGSRMCDLSDEDDSKEDDNDGEGDILKDYDRVIKFFDSDIAESKRGFAFSVFDLILMALHKVLAHELLAAIMTRATDIQGLWLDARWGNFMPEEPPTDELLDEMTQIFARLVGFFCTGLKTLVIDITDLNAVPPSHRNFVARAMTTVLQYCPQLKEVVFKFVSANIYYPAMRTIAAALAEHPSIERLKVGVTETLVALRIICPAVARLRKLTMFSMEAGDSFDVGLQFPNDISTVNDAL